MLISIVNYYFVMVNIVDNIVERTSAPGNFDFVLKRLVADEIDIESF